MSEVNRKHPTCPILVLHNEVLSILFSEKQRQGTYGSEVIKLRDCYQFFLSKVHKKNFYHHQGIYHNKEIIDKRVGFRFR
jgi:hypothetical protein